MCIYTYIYIHTQKTIHYTRMSTKKTLCVYVHWSTCLHRINTNHGFIFRPELRPTCLRVSITRRCEVDVKVALQQSNVGMGNPLWIVLFLFQMGNRLWIGIFHCQDCMITNLNLLQWARKNGNPQLVISVTKMVPPMKWHG